VVWGTDGVESFTTLTNAARSYLVYGFGDNDVVLTGANNDEIYGGDGDDSLNGGAGIDTITGGAGNDTLIGGLGIDVFIVDAGTDTITGLGQGGADVLAISAGATANATIHTAWTASSATRNQGGSLANAVITTSGLAVNLSGATVSAETEGYTVTNTGVATTLTGSAANDSITGGSGDDTLIGGVGADTLTGGAGADTFVQANGSSGSVSTGWQNLYGNVYIGNGATIDTGGFADVITNFDSSVDRLDATEQGAVDSVGSFGHLMTTNNWFTKGDYSGTTFTANYDSGSDIFFYVSTGADQTVAANIGTTSVVLIGAASGFNSSTNII
jgi:Ca2+-binding RTX toxin-like protein